MGRKARPTMNARTWTLIGRDGNPYESDVPGTLGGHRKQRLYGRLDCRAALQAIARGGYVHDRVFFRDEDHAKAAGYRACAVCMPAEYAQWRENTMRRAVRDPAHARSATKPVRR